MGSILLVESEPDAHDRQGTALRDAGHSVLTAATIREAFQRVSEGGIDVIVVDAYDPRVGIVELARLLQNLPDAPPMILVSSSPHAPEISARIGAAVFLTKPCEPSDLVAAVERHSGEVRPVRSFDDEPTGPARHV